ncbi:MAG: apolipoprotein N-acyltransferase, partial [Nitrospirota bacterium]|nr:apolipoprotein N-acyltransferase [Nitrospirota bacterium]
TGKAFRYGWLAGTIAFVGTTPWVITAMHQFGQVPFVVSGLLMLLLASYLGVFVGAYAWGYVRVQRSCSSWLWLAAPALWVSLEYLRTYALSGFPWMLLGYSQYQWLPVIQLSDMTGVYGVSFLVVMGNVAITSILMRVWQRKDNISGSFPWQPALAFSVMLSAALVYGHWQINQQAIVDTTAKSLSIGLIQPNISQDKKWDAAYIDETLNRYTNLSKQTGRNLDLLIWPEAATPFFFEKEIGYQKTILSILRNTQSPLLFGSPTLRFEPDGTPFLLNSAYMLSPEKLLTGRYDKRHLVPFGEYVPLKWLLFFLEKLVVGIGDFKPGQGPMTLSLPESVERPHASIGVPICFEIIFPDLVRQMAKEGANVLVTLTNDAWFGDSSAPYQHFSMAVFRAVENHVAVARAANTGISGFIGPDGRILTQTPIFTEQAVTGSIPLRTSPPTFYTQYGDVFSWGCVILTGIFLVASRRKPAPQNTSNLSTHQA